MLSSCIVRRILQPIGKGVTSPHACTLDGVIKFDSDEAPHGVYNELVAQRIGERIGAPIAAGSVTVVQGGQAFASLKAGAPGLSLPDLLPSQIAKAASIYPEEVAALTVFDVFIGNWDRAANLKAAVASPHLKLFAAFDHGHALLGVEEDPDKSISRLGKPDLIVSDHPFAAVVAPGLIGRLGKRVRQLDDSDLQSCCAMGGPFRSVSMDMQQRLATALCARRDAMTTLLKAVWK